MPMFKVEWSDLSFMCPEFIQSFFAGLAASGLLTSALRLITKATFNKTNYGLRKGVMLFLAISTFLEFLCIFLVSFVFAKLPIVKYYRKKAASEGFKRVSADLAAGGIDSVHNKTEVIRIKNEHPDDSNCIVNDRVKGRLKVTRCIWGWISQTGTKEMRNDS